MREGRNSSQDDALGRTPQNVAQRMENHPEVAGLPSGSLEDKDLTLAFQTGDKGAYQAIHDRYSQRVYGVCRRMLGHDDAQEAAQETFLRVYQALGRFNGRYQLGPWITRIATNVCLDHLRAKARRPSDPVANEVLVLEEAAANGDHSEPERVVIRNAESRDVRKVLAKLPPMHRAAIVLRDFEGLSYEEVAIALQISECQAKALIHRARQNFKRSWSKSLSALLPWRLIERLRGVDASVREHSVEAVTVVQSVNTCTGMLQQCGQYMSQQVATVVTAAIVGTAVGAASHAATTPPRPEEMRRPVTAASTSKASGSRSYKILSQTAPRDAEAEAKRAKTQTPPAVVEIAPTPAETPSPLESPAPAATPDESPTPADSPAGPAPSETQAPPPAPFAPAIGFDYGRAVPGRVPRSHNATVSCTRDALEQRVETVIEDDDSGATYPAVLLLHWGATSRLSLELTVLKNGVEIYYSGIGDLVDGSYPEGQRKMSFVGNYGTFSEQARSMDLPTSGRFTAGLTLDCAALSVITESVVLGA